MATTTRKKKSRTNTFIKNDFSPPSTLIRLSLANGVRISVSLAPKTNRDR